MDFSVDPALEDQLADISRYVQERLVPLEPVLLSQDWAALWTALEECRGEIRARGWWAPPCPPHPPQPSRFTLSPLSQNTHSHPTKTLTYSYHSLSPPLASPCLSPPPNRLNSPSHPFPKTPTPALVIPSHLLSPLPLPLPPSLSFSLA